VAVLLGTQRSGDEASFVPLAQHDTPVNRLLCASATHISREYSNQSNLASEPFWLALDDLQREQVTKLVSQSHSQIIMSQGQHSISIINRLVKACACSSATSSGACFTVNKKSSLHLMPRVSIACAFLRKILASTVPMVSMMAKSSISSGAASAAWLGFHGVVRDCDAFHDAGTDLSGSAYAR
jgi:hypothetical protein